MALDLLEMCEAQGAKTEKEKDRYGAIALNFFLPKNFHLYIENRIWLSY